MRPIGGRLIKAAAEKLKSLKLHVPEVLTGTFGLDIFGGVASAMLRLVYSAMIFAGALLAYFLPKLIPTLPCVVLHSSGPPNIISSYSR
jgi:hypothetical protein